MALGNFSRAEPHSTGAAAASPPLLVRYGGDAKFPPYEFLNAQGEPTGLNVDLIRAIAKVQGFEVQIQLQPWPRVRAGLSNGQVQVAAMYRSAHRAQEVDFAIPHELIYHEMFVRRDHAPLRSLADLAGKRVLVEAETYSVDVLTELGYGSELRRSPSEPAALEALARGEGDVAIVTQTPGRPFQERRELSEQITATGPPVLLTEYAFVTAKGNRELIETLNQGVAAVKASGEYDHIYNRWIRPDRSAALAHRIAWALGLALVAFLLVALWNRSLRRRVLQQTEALRREYAERERAQAALAESERSLRQAQKLEAIGRLAGGIAHDFNNILTIILNYGSMLREELARRKLDTTDADEILAASERATRLTKQLLVFSHATPMKTERLDLGAVVRDMKVMIQRLVGEHIQVEATLPPAPVVIEADTSQIEQTLLNLAANARDAMPNGGRLAVQVSSRTLPAENSFALPAGDYASLLVADNGIGMDAATLGHIFEPFFTTKAVGKGTGLGLATVFANVTKLNGKITVESSPGRGAAFTVLLPKCAAPAEVPPPPPALATPHGAGQTILLVEDDDALRRAGTIALERAGYRVVEAEDGERAVTLMTRQDPFAAVVTDVVMPRLSGPGLVSELRGRFPKLRVLYVSGYVHESATLDLSVPGTAFLPKPYTGAELLNAVHALLK